jgi:quinol monooxygenase YgiN
MPKTALFASFKAAPGKLDELVAALRPLIDHVGTEPGTEVYAMHTSGDDTVWFYELYADDDAFKTHGGSEAMKAAFGRTAGLTEGRPEVLMGSPVVGKGVPF